jgi:DNA repair protein RadC
MKKVIINPEFAQGNHKNYENKIPMRFWAEDDLPSQKFLLKGTGSMSDAELLSIIIGTGIPGENSLDIARKMLSLSGNNLSEFWKCSVSDLQDFKGIGEKIAVQICAMFALARRRNESDVIQKAKISCSGDAFEIFNSLMGDLPHEEFWIILLNKANKVIKKVRVSEGGISVTVVDQRNFIKLLSIVIAEVSFSEITIPVGISNPVRRIKRLQRKSKSVEFCWIWLSWIISSLQGISFIHFRMKVPYK